MEDKIRIGYLFDFYGELLNQHQREIMEDYFFNDLSLSEIADEHDVSRQGVHDLIKRCTKTLEGYEEKLHLLDKFLSIKDKVNQINIIASSDAGSKMTDISRLSNEILDSL